MTERPLEYLDASEIAALMDEADGRALSEVVKARAVISEAANSAARAIGAGGRLIYFGAGTSGRLGVLDASECPPTFSSGPDQVIGVIAGGDKALRDAVEGAEDDPEAGRAAVRGLSIGPADMVVGISASGTAPYVLGALSESKARGAEAWLLSCSGERGANLEYRNIALDTGAEVVRGSSRLAAGTATKLVLNRITTSAFIMSGKVYGGLMVDVRPSNVKLVKRAAGIIMEVTGVSEAEARRYLEESGMSAKTACVMAARGVTRDEAVRLLDENRGFLREALK